MYTFLATFYDMDGRESKFTIEIDLNCIDNEDLDNMNPDLYAWMKACKCAMAYIERKDPVLSLSSIQFISC